MFSFSQSYGAWPRKMNVFASHILEFRTWAELADMFKKNKNKKTWFSPSYSPSFPKNCHEVTVLVNHMLEAHSASLSPELLSLGYSGNLFPRQWKPPGQGNCH